MKIHFIAIGGSAMHNLALALHYKGYQISGSDDEIFDPAKSRLSKVGLMPDKTGWFPEKITKNLDAVILGMHARENNPELFKAKELGIKIYSYPEFLYEQSKNKTRIVVGGSHGKTTITAMIIHVLQYLKIDCDYMVGAQLEGFDVMVKLSDDAKIMVIEGDEYLTSPIDRRPKFHVYQPTIGIISGIAWDHINVFPTFEFYVEQFKIFAEMIPENGYYIYCKDDVVLQEMSDRANIKASTKVGYCVHPHFIENGTSFLETEFGNLSLKIFGKHNLTNINAARLACRAVGVSDKQFYSAVQSFNGASNRLELLRKSETCAIYKDFAHSPSKLKATVEALKAQFPGRKLVACMELHTFSSLTENFLQQYAGAMDCADVGIIFFNPETVAHKKLPPISSEMILNAFKRNNLEVFHTTNQFVERIIAMNSTDTVFAFMSSGNFGDVNLLQLAENIMDY
ncbi:MAG: Mur ligase domain-containing protein [Bacteroidales bacterium]|jgi:UDP-N-acetylmuramate: L-alanyl-gamma-D-glutamyl-meso-diaminopimelate ligase|nr:Mur ligase domain-containing protein [Bacteroidales bacterium]